MGSGFCSKIPVINALSNVWRSLTLDWSRFNNHSLCAHTQKKHTGYSCLFCYIRSLSLRGFMTKKPRISIEPVELQSQLDHYEAVAKLNLTDENVSLKNVLEASLFLMDKYENSISQYCKNYNVTCSKCHKCLRLSNSWMLEIDAKFCMNYNLPEIIEEVTKKSLLSHSKECKNSSYSTWHDQKILLIHFMEAQKINIRKEFVINGVKFNYKCHVRELESQKDFQCYFLHNGKFFYDDNGVIKESCST